MLRRVYALGCIILCACVGCGGNENLGRVAGTVTLDGEALPNAFIIFAPTSGGTTSYGRTDAEGKYEMMFSDNEKGAWLGENRVQINTGDVDPTMSGAGSKEKVPAVYNQKSTLLVQVDSGSNTHDFELDSSAGRIVEQPAE